MSIYDREGAYRRTVLDNGLRIVTEWMPHIRSVAIGIWFDTGSRDEPDHLSGISHFLEHMNFKGTKRRSAASIARQIESRGGSLNAFTSKEYTCYFARVIDRQLSRAVDVLTDITQNSVYNPDDINKERAVILEELKNIEDTPDELVFDYFFAQLYNPHSLGRPVIGRRDTLREINRENLVEYSSDHFTGSHVVVAATGNIDHNRLVRTIEHRIDSESATKPMRRPPSDRAETNNRQDIHTNTQQAHICWGCRAYPYRDPRKYALLVLNTLIGGGMSSRLFQQIRERHGLAYSVFSFLETYVDTGLFGVYAGTEPKHAERVLRMILTEIKRFVKDPVSLRTLQRTKEQLKGNLILGLESPDTRMHRLAKMEIYNVEWLSLDDVVDRIDAVTEDDVRTVARELFYNNPDSVTILLPN